MSGINGFREKCLKKDDVLSLLREAGYRPGDRKYESVMESYRNTEVAMERGITDELTGLHNNAFYEPDLVRELNRKKRRPDDLRTSVLATDLDNFKAINDNLGHEAGDRTLKYSAKAVLKAIRKADTAYRTGGDEFNVILPEASPGSANLVRNRILRKAEDYKSRFIRHARNFNVPFTDEQWEAIEKLGMSIGTSFIENSAIGNPEKDAKNLTRVADEGMYRNKKSSR